MRSKALIAAAGAVALAGSPALGRDASVARASAPAESASEMSGSNSTGLIVGVVAIALAVFLAMSGGGDEPDSP
jgi:hypothetical protein